MKIEIEDADEKLTHLRDCQENVKRQILMLKNQINDLTADDASVKDQDGDFV